MAEMFIFAAGTIPVPLKNILYDDHPCVWQARLGSPAGKPGWEARLGSHMRDLYLSSMLYHKVCRTMSAEPCLQNHVCRTMSVKTAAISGTDGALYNCEQVHHMT